MAGVQGRGGGGGGGTRRPHATSRRRAEVKRVKDQGEGGGDKRGVKGPKPLRGGKTEGEGMGGRKRVGEWASFKRKQKKGNLRFNPAAR